MLILNAFFFVLDHGVLSFNVIDLIVEDNELMFFILKLIEFLLKHGDKCVPLHGVSLLHCGVAVHHHNSRYITYY